MDQPLRSPRAAQTRSALLSAGVELLVERPVDAIAIDEFVAAARVAKGSFFNHFTDKRQFANIIAHDIRAEIERWVGRVNSGIQDPLERLAGGMIAAAAYARANPQRTVVIARSFNGISLDDHPINAGLLTDLRDSRSDGLIDMPSEQAAVRYWLGACQIVMGSIVASQAGEAEAKCILSDMLHLSLRGLAATPARISDIAGSKNVGARFLALDRGSRN